MPLPFALLIWWYGVTFGLLDATLCCTVSGFDLDHEGRD